MTLDERVARMMDGYLQGEFSRAIFLPLYHRFARTYNLTVRRRHQVHLEGTGRVFDNETGAQFFQTEQRFPFDAAELQKPHEKLVRHIIDALWLEIRENFRATADLKDGERVLFLAQPELNPVWVTAFEPGDPLAGCLQANVRWTVCLPDHLPFGVEGPKLIVPKSVEQTAHEMDVHAVIEDNKKEAAHQLTESREKIENLFKIDLDAPVAKKDENDA